MNAIASELSFQVWQKQQAERDGRDVPRVTAPAEKPAKFDGFPVSHGRVESGLVVYVDGLARVRVAR